MFQIVKNNFNKSSISQPNKTIAAVLLDGTYTKEDLRSFNVAFPANTFNSANDPEGPYSGQDAMFQFIRTIGPYLSDQSLYKLVDALTDLACDAGDGVLRGSSVARCALFYELERNSKASSQHNFPDQFLSHVKRHLVSLFRRLNPDTAADNITRLSTHNINETIMDPTVVARYKDMNLYEAVSQFDETKFDVNNLPNQAEDKNKFEELLGGAKKSSPPKEKPFEISRPKGATIDATAFFTTTPKVGDAMAAEVAQLEKECNILARRIDDNSEILKKLKAELPKETNEETVKHYSSVRTRLEDQLQADAERLQTLKTAIARLQEKIPKVGGPKR